MTTSTHTEPPGVGHYALFYRSARQYLDAVVPYVVAGLDMGEPVLVAAPADNLELLRGELGDAVAAVTTADMTEVGRNPARIMGTMGTFVAEHADRPVRIVGEPVWPGRSAEEYPACVQNEALVGAAFAGSGAAVLCPYDAGKLDADVLADALRTHPLFWQDGSLRRSAHYAPDDALARYNQPLPGDQMAVTYLVRTAADLSPARSFAARYAQWLGLARDGVADLELIVTELATNSLLHAGAACRLALWQRDGHIVCEAADSGRLDDPLAGRRPPSSDSGTGRGLFVVNAIADLVRTYATGEGTTIQAYLRLSPSPGAII